MLADVATFCARFPCFELEGVRYNCVGHDPALLAGVGALLADEETYVVKVAGKNNVDDEDQDELRREVSNVVRHVLVCFRASNCVRFVLVTEGDNIERLRARYSPFSEAQELLLRECAFNDIETHVVMVKSQSANVSRAFVDGWNAALENTPVSAFFLMAGTTEDDRKASCTFEAARLVVFIGTERKESYMWKTGVDGTRIMTTGYRHLRALRSSMPHKEYKLAFDVSCFGK